MVDAYSRAPGPESTVAAMVEALTSEEPKLVYKTTTDAKFGPKVVGMVRDQTYDHFILKAVRRAGEKRRAAGA